MRLPARLDWLTGRASLLGLIALGASGVAGLGCREELGPERFATTTVRGVILVGGRSVPGGFVVINPVDGTSGNLRTGPIAADGSFRLDRVPVGKVVLGLDRLPIPAIPSTRGPVDPRVFSLTASSSVQIPLRRIIPAGPTHQIPPIDLLMEVARHRRGTPPGRRKRRSGQVTVRASRRGARKPRLGLGYVPPNNPAGSQLGHHALIIRITYRDSAGAIHVDWPIARLQEALDDRAGTAWIDIGDLDATHNPEVERLLRETFHFHPLAIEDALQDVHVPRIDDWHDYLYLVINTLDFHPDTDEVQLHELDLFLGPNYLVSYHHEPIEVLDRCRRLIDLDPTERLRPGASYLLHHVLDDVVDQFFPAIEHLDVAIEDAQDEVFDHATPDTLRRIFQVKNSALQLNRVVSPMREVLNRLARDPYPQVAAEHRVYFRDVYDHLVRVHDVVEGLRDLINGALDTYLSVVSNRTNEIMKVLTLLNVMFLPMTFLAGFFGMNFFGETLMFTAPILPKTALFWLTVTMMVSTPLVMWQVARRRGWF